eukprot:3931750-Rhodomonas_salina.1
MSLGNSQPQLDTRKNGSTQEMNGAGEPEGPWSKNITMDPPVCKLCGTLCTDLVGTASTADRIGNMFRHPLSHATVFLTPCQLSQHQTVSQKLPCSYHAAANNNEHLFCMVLLFFFFSASSAK